MNLSEKEKLKKISLRGRYAFGLICLEKLIQHYAIDSKEVRGIILKMWNITSSEKLGVWHGFLVEHNPRIIIEEFKLFREGKFQFNDIDYDTINNELELRNRYNTLRTLPEKVMDLIDKLYEIATIDLYGGCGEFSERTYKATIELIEIMETFPTICLPEIKVFEFSSFEQNSGWGNSFLRDSILF